MTAGIAVAQSPASDVQPSATDGFTVHQSMDLGGHIANISGSGAMYDTLVNIQSGPRVLGETFDMRALPGKKHTLFDSLSAIGNGFGGDPNNFAKLDFSKGKLYEFSGLFRRDRQYFDYDLLGNPNIPSGQSITDPTTHVSVPWSQVNQSPFMFNTVRRMTDTNLTIFPLSKVTFRAGYSQNIFQGPSLTPGGFSEITSPVVFIYDNVVAEYQRNSTDDFIGGVDWKPVAGTKLTYEEQIDHYKNDSYFTMAPNAYNVQEADGTKAALLASYDTWIAPTAASLCNAGAVGGFPYLSANSNGGLPVVNPACAVMTSYLRTQPTRILYPTEIFHLQSSSIKNVSMNGDARYTSANMNMPNYYENFQGLTLPGANGALRGFTYQGNASAKRKVMAADYGIIWQAMKAFSLSDQFNFSNAQQPGTAAMTSASALVTPAVAADETITYPGALNTVAVGTNPGNPALGTPENGYFGQKFVTNNLTGTWDASSRATLSLTYRYQTHIIAQGSPHNVPLPAVVTFPPNGTVTINENGVILNAAMRPTNNWTINGTIEALYDDNAFTPVGPRQTRHYRVHSLYKPRPWASFSGAFNDLERHNNTSNISATPVDGPLGHVDHSRIVSLGAVLAPNEHYGLDFNYAYSDVYTSTNICYDAAPTPTLPGAATPSGTACPGATVRGAPYYEFGPVKDFTDAPTQFASVALTTSPVKSVHSNIGYRISAVNGSQFFNDPRAVNGSLNSSYVSPFLNVAWTIHPGWIWRGEYNYFGYGEGGPSGASLCSTTNPTPTVPVTPVACSTLPFQTGMNISSAGETAPRNFHANNLTFSMHYEF
ncbi:MAG: hypothetical protein ABSF70_12620 [Terracidiphilus sp.]|jgi:hypothetical protein